jgi:hypothetical protein
MFQWVEGVTPEQIAAVGDALFPLPAIIPEIRSFRFGPDARLAEGNYDYVVTADFDDVDGFRAYRDHPDHRMVARQVIGPILAARAAVQFDAGSPPEGVEPLPEEPPTA